MGCEKFEETLLDFSEWGKAKVMEEGGERVLKRER